MILVVQCVWRSKEVEVRLFDGVFDGTLDGVFDGTLDGVLDGTFDGVLDGTFDGVFDGTFDGTLNGTFGRIWPAGLATQFLRAISCCKCCWNGPSACAKTAAAVACGEPQC